MKGRREYWSALQHSLEGGMTYPRHRILLAGAYTYSL